MKNNLISEVISSTTEHRESLANAINCEYCHDNYGTANVPLNLDLYHVITVTVQKPLTIMDFPSGPITETFIYKISIHVIYITLWKPDIACAIIMRDATMKYPAGRDFGLY
jgi:hypothetical protein